MNVVSLVDQWADELRPLLDASIEFVLVDRHDADALAQALPDADVIFSMTFDGAMAARCRKLRLILCPAAGTEHIDRAALPPGVVVVNSSGPEIPMAEYVIGALVALRQNVRNADRRLRDGYWTQGAMREREFVGELYGSNLALIGYGRTGQEVAVRARAFGMYCRAATMRPDAPRRHVNLLERLIDVKDASALDRLVAWADAVVLCAELSSVTRGMLDARRFSLMKPTAVLVNVARGPIAVERDLYESLRDGRIAGAAIDVWYRYPKRDERQLPSEFPFQELDNIIMTPHSSAWTLPHKKRKLAFWSSVLNEFAKTL